jgi:YVTN family beta-propeller protein
VVDRRVLFGLVAWVAALGVALASAGGAGAAPFVYVTNFSQGDDVSQYDASSGALSPLSPFSVAAGSHPVAIAVSPDAKSVYVVNQGDDTVTQYTINSTTGQLSAKLRVATGPGPSAIAVSSDGKSAYVTNHNNSTVSQYTIDSTTGQLSAKTPATIGAGNNPLAIALSPDGTSAYVTNDNPFPAAATVSQYTINPTTGTLSPKTPATIGTEGSAPDGIAVSPDGRSAYVTGTVVTQFTIDPTTGLLSGKTPSFVQGSGFKFAVSPDGKSAYLTNGVSVSQYTINPTTGTLSPKTPATVAGGGDPHGIVVAPVRTCPKVFGGCNVGLQLEGSAATVTTTLLAAGTVGILVQRIVGKQIVTIGRVPLGHHHAGHVSLRWNLSVNGHKLPPGRYLITLRALGASGQVIALTAPVKITIHAKKRRRRG